MRPQLRPARGLLLPGEPFSPVLEIRQRVSRKGSQPFTLIFPTLHSATVQP